MDELKTQLKEFAKSLGMNFCGVGNAERLDGAPEGKKPRDTLPGCKSVIVIGARLLDGVIQANFRAVEDNRWDLKGLYGTYGYSTLPNFELTYACYAIARFIEANTKAIAAPLSTGPMTNGMQISIRHAAVAAGLGEFGHLGIVLTPEFGPRNRFGVILTTLEIEPDPLYNGPALCTQCGVCARVCPTGAIPAPGTEEPACVNIGEKVCTYGKLNYPKCNKGIMAMNKAIGGREDYLTELEPTWEDIAAASRKMPLESSGLSHANSWMCGRCLSYCTAGDWNDHFRKNELSKGASAAFFDEKK